MASKKTQPEIATSVKGGKADPAAQARVIAAADEMYDGGQRLHQKMPTAALVAVSGSLTYSRTWQIAATRIAERMAADGQDLFVPGSVKADPEKLAETVIAMRDHRNYSWGIIGVLLREPESLGRKVYAANSGKLDRGTRIGHGGRFLRDDEALYNAADRKGSGVQIKGKALADDGKAIKDLQEAARKEDGITFSKYVINSKLEGAAKPKRVRKPKAAEAVAA